MLNLPVFQDNSVQGFYDRLLASKPVPGTGKPDPTAMARFLAAHPETAVAMSAIKQQPPTSGFADSTFRGSTPSTSSTRPASVHRCDGH